LAISRQIAQLLGGDTWVESELSKGSVFHFTGWVEKSKKTFETKPSLEVVTGKRVLMVDDNLKNLEILSHILNAAGMRPYALSEARQVLAKIQEEINKGDPFDICMLDIHMPHMNGFTVTRQIRDHAEPRIAHLPLIAFSSSTAKQTHMYKESGFDGFLPKPVQRSKLITMIRRLLGDKAVPEEKRKRDAVLTQHSLTEEAKHSVRILLVEDNLLNKKLAVNILTKAGYQVEAVGNGKEAVEAYTCEPAKFDLILMDIQMPLMNGIEATKEIRKIEKELSITRSSQPAARSPIPIIAMTADAMKEDQERCLKSGMNDFIAKPIKREVVFNMVKKWLLNTI
jgi:CheY-like chemotaxis protein